MNFYKDQRGLSLVEIVIACGLLATFALGISTVLYDSTKASRGVALTNEFETLMTNVQQVLSAESSCTAFLQSRLNAETGSMNLVVPRNLTEVSAPGLPKVIGLTPVGQKGRLNVTQVALTQIQTNLGNLPDGTTAQIVTFQIEAERLVSATNDKAVGAHKLTKSFPITVITNPAGAVVNCYQDPRLVDVCTALGGDPNSNGQACNIDREICRQLGGAYTFGANPPCAYSGAGTPPIPPLNFTERVCIDMGGQYMGVGAVPACRFNANGDIGATSLTAICTSIKGTFGGGGAPADRCGICTAHGGEWNAAIGGCDFARKACEGRAFGGFTPTYDPATQICNSQQADCARQGGRLDGAICRIPVQWLTCNMAAGGHSYTIGDINPGNGSYGPTGWAGNCPDGWYVRSLSGHASRNEDDERDGWEAQVMCCKVTP